MGKEKFFAFVLIPFDDAFADVYKMGIKETAAQLGIEAERVDEQIFQEGMLERIYRQIEAADIIIADMSGQNPNVFYEVGYAHAQEKICILLTKDADDIPFDLKHHRHILYGASISYLRSALMDELVWAKQQIENERESHIRVNLKNIFGSLVTTKYTARGIVNFEIDFSNESNKASAEIEAVYFYSTKSWSLKQDNKECSSTKSDISGFELRHFLVPPIRRLHKGSWAQLKFESNKLFAYATKGEEIKDSYRVSGRSIIRLVTSEGNFDFKISIDTVCDEIPF